MIDMDEERAAMRVIAFLATLAVAFAALVAALIISGCASLTQDEIARLDAIFWEWVADREAKGDKPPSAEPMPDTPPERFRKTVSISQPTGEITPMPVMATLFIVMPPIRYTVRFINNK